MPTWPDHRRADPHTSGMPAATAASFAAKRVSFVSEPSIRMSAPASSVGGRRAGEQSAMGDDASCRGTANARRRQRSRPSRGRRRRAPCRICRCRLVSSTRSSSTIVMVPTPAAARIGSDGAAEAARADHDGVGGGRIVLCAASPKPGRIRCRAYLAASERAVSAIPRFFHRLTGAGRDDLAARGCGYLWSMRTRMRR